MGSPSFRFHAETHSYFVNGQERPHITWLLEQAGLGPDERWLTAECKVRGQAVHQLTADYDLDALEPDTLVSPYRGYLLGYVAAMKLIAHEWDQIEEPRVHPVHLFGGRPDRVGRIYGAAGVLELKTTAAPDRAHEIQTALQVMLTSSGHPLSRESWWRGALYLKPDGKWKLIEHTHRRDFDDADRILRTHCPPPCVPTSSEREEPYGSMADRRGDDRDRPQARHRRAAARRAS